MNKQSLGDIESASPLSRANFQQDSTALPQGSKRRKKLLLIGNGPSTRRLAEYGFHRIPEDFDTFGMGAAYRYFHLIGWWPTYYAWCDKKVVHSHRDALTKLINNPGIPTRRFFFSLPLSTHERFEQVPHSSTGDFCFKKALELGYEEIYLIGVEGNYVEEVANSRRINKAEISELRKAIPGLGKASLVGIRVIDSTIFHTDNYFFPWYQMAGDIYSLPKAHLHRSFWEKCRDDAFDAGVSVVNLSNQSLLKGFESADLTGVFHKEGDIKSIANLEFVTPDSSTNVALIAFPTLRTDAERGFWEGVRGQLAARGYRPVILSYFLNDLASNQRIEGVDQYFIAIAPRDVVGAWGDEQNAPNLNSALQSLAGYGAVRAYFRSDADRFEEATAVALHLGSTGIARSLSMALDTLKPAVIALTNDTHQVPVLVEEIARQRSIPLFHVERSPLITNWIEKDGFYAEAEAWSTPNSWEHDPSLDDIGAKVMEAVADNPAMHRAGQSDEQAVSSGLPDVGSSPTILIAMDAVLNTGWAIPGHPKRALNYPLFHTPEQAVRAIVSAAAQIGAKVVLKPHPQSFPFDTVTEVEGATVYQGAIEEALEKADIVVCFLTKVAFAAIAQRKKVVTLAPNIAALSGAVFHCETESEIAAAFRKALDHVWSEEDETRVRRFFGWLQRDYFVSNDLSNPGAKKFIDRYFPPRESSHLTAGESDTKSRMGKIPAIFPRVESIDPAGTGERTESMLYGPFARADDFRLDEVDIVLNLFRTGVLTPERERGMMIDVGACKGGAFTDFAKMGWRVHAFEPNPPMHSYIKKRIRQLSGVTLNQLAVSEKSGEELPFYTSEESIGISSLSPFRDTHKPTAIVKTIRLDEYFGKAGIEHADFLKVDTEGFDLMVLKSHDWEKVRPQAIVCEFEDFKTDKLGYSVEDLARFLMERGYKVYASEWHPITRYGGGEHRWRAFHRWQAGVLPKNSWGNLVAFRDPIDEDVLRDITWQTIETARLRRLGKEAVVALRDKHSQFGPPEPVAVVEVASGSVLGATPSPMPIAAKIAATETKETRPAKAAGLAEVPRAASATANKPKTHQIAATVSPPVGDTVQTKPRRVPPAPSLASVLRASYGELAVGLSEKAPPLFRIGQAVVWIVRAARRHKLTTAALLAVCGVFAALPFLQPLAWDWRFTLWGVAILLALAAAIAALLREAFRRFLFAQELMIASRLKSLRHASDRSARILERKLVEQKNDFEGRAALIDAKVAKAAKMMRAELRELAASSQSGIKRMRREHETLRGEIAKATDDAQTGHRTLEEKLKEAIEVESVNITSFIESEISAVENALQQLGRDMKVSDELLRQALMTKIAEGDASSGAALEALHHEIDQSLRNELDAFSNAANASVEAIRHDLDQFHGDFNHVRDEFNYVRGDFDYRLRSQLEALHNDLNQFRGEFEGHASATNQSQETLRADIQADIQAVRQGIDQRLHAEVESYAGQLRELLMEELTQLVAVKLEEAGAASSDTLRSEIESLRESVEERFRIELENYVTQATGALKVEIDAVANVAKKIRKTLGAKQEEVAQAVRRGDTALKAEIGETRRIAETQDKVVARLKSGFERMKSQQGHSLDVVSALRAMRPLWFGGSAVDTLLRQPEIEHGHALLMAVLADEERAQPGLLFDKTLIEIGTTRERDPIQKSTEKLAIFTAMTGMRFITVDVDPLNTEHAEKTLRYLNPVAQATTAKGEDYLALHPGSLDFIYLDAFDFDHGNHSEQRQERYKALLRTEINDLACWRMHEACAEIIVARMRQGGIVVLDDTWADVDGGYAGKGKLAIPLLLERGFEIVAKNRTAIALKRLAKESDGPIEKLSAEAKPASQERRVSRRVYGEGRKGVSRSKKV